MERIRITDLLDRDDVKIALGINNSQFLKLGRSVHLPAPVVDTGDQRLWDANEVELFRRKLDSLKAKGFVVPDVCYRWEDVTLEERVHWPLVSKPKKRERLLRNRPEPGNYRRQRVEKELDI